MKQLGVAFRMYAHDYGADSPYSIPYAEKLYPHYITDAQVGVTDFLNPPFPHWRSLPAIALVNDSAFVTAVGIDGGYESIFLRQIIAYGQPQDP